ncbi:MAG: hypothetical protein H0W90_01140 [Actinobacteria bacterium]|nr:hypothetical protein [Actinomycetota bacterium]
MGRAAALLVLGTALGLYYSSHDRLWDASTWWDIAFLSFVLIPACFALVWLVLPLRVAPGLALAALAFGLAAFLLHLAGASTPENFCKLFGVTALGFWFLRYFESLSWIVLVALIIPWVDAYSVWRGPTKVIVNEHRNVFTNFSFAFPIPGETAAANLGLPDLLFFSLFLAAAVRWNLRTRLTWALLTVSFGATLALAVWRDIGGLPALPLLALGFLLANGDLLWTRVRTELREERSDRTETRSSGRSEP